jgi:hypothetical protein
VKRRSEKEKGAGYRWMGRPMGKQEEEYGAEHTFAALD